MDSDPPPPYEPSSSEGNVADDDAGNDDPGNNAHNNSDDIIDGSFDSALNSSDDWMDDSSDSDVAGPNWSREHLLAARTAIASYPKATRALQRQVLEEQEMIRLGIEHRGPPPAHNPRLIVGITKHSTRLENEKPTTSIFGLDIEEKLDDAIIHDKFGWKMLMPGLPTRIDPLKNALGGVETMPVRNPSIQWGAMVPRRHFPGAEIESVIPEMNLTPEYVVLRRHVCGTECPDDCHEGGGVRTKGKGSATVGVEDVEGGETMEGVVYAHWGKDNFDESEDSGSDQERQEKLREQQELETIETLEHCTIIERHRRKWAAEIGALTDKARILTARLPAICLNTIEPKQKAEVELNDPTFYLAGKMIKRLDDNRNRADRVRQEKGRLAKIRIGKWRAQMAGRDTTHMGDEAGEAVFESLVDSGDTDALEDDLDSVWQDLSSDEPAALASDDMAPGPAPRSPDKEESAIDDDNVEVSHIEDIEESKPQDATSLEEVPEEIRSLEATSEETAEEESIAQALIAQAAIVRDATSPNPDLQEVPILEREPEETVSGKVAPDQRQRRPPLPSHPPPCTPPTAEEATREKTTAEKAITEETSAQETSGQEPGHSRKRSAPERKSPKARPAKRQSIRESPFQSLEREAPPLYILQRDGRLIRNPLADSHSGPQAGRRWSDPHIGASIPIPPSDSEPRRRSATISEGVEPPVPFCSAEEVLPSIGDEGQRTQHVEYVTESPTSLPPAEAAQQDRERTPPPPPSPRLRHQSSPVSAASYLSNLWSSSDDLFPSIERLSEAASPAGGGGAADVTSPAPSRASTPEPPEMSREPTRRRPGTLRALTEASDEEPEDPDAGFRVVITTPRTTEFGMPYRPLRGPSVLRREYLIEDETLEAEEPDRAAVIAALFPDPPSYNTRSKSRSSASSENPSPATRSIFSREASGRSSEATSVSTTPAGSEDLTGEEAEDESGEKVVEGEQLLSSPDLATNRPVVDGDGTSGEGDQTGNMWREGSAGREGSIGSSGSMGREGSSGSDGSTSRGRSIGREGSVTTEVAETLGSLAVESEAERVGEEGEADEGAGVLDRVLPSTEAPEEAIEDDGDGAPLTRVSSHSSTHSS
ncbi:hypothetical protein O988_02158 [Pseudogymnoascus sp. VKM F-3808]|nr:hypothetical protein O988_02158 [Pseudogymnoascus sp. VKM F-3808]